MGDVYWLHGKPMRSSGGCVDCHKGEDEERQRELQKGARTLRSQAEDLLLRAERLESQS